MSYQEIALIRQQEKTASIGSMMFGHFFGKLSVFLSRELLEKNLKEHENLLKFSPNQNWKFINLVEFILPDDSTIIGGSVTFRYIVIILY